MNKFIIIILTFILFGCASKCKTPWWKIQPNKYYQKEQKQSGKKYKSHKRLESRKNKCRK